MKTRVTRSIVVLITILSLSSIFAATPGQVVDIKKSEELPVFTVQTDSNVELRITFYRPDVFRIQAATNGAYADPENDPEKAQILVIDEIGKTEVTTQDGDEQIVFSTAAVKSPSQAKTANLSPRPRWPPTTCSPR